MIKAVAKKLSIEELKDMFGNYLFILPAVAIFAVFYIYPFFEIFNLSLRDWNGISLAKEFIGLDNFKEILQDKVWWSSMWHAGYITLIALTFQNALAFALALSCDRDIRMKKFYRVVFYPRKSTVVVQSRAERGVIISLNQYSWGIACKNRNN